MRDLLHPHALTHAPMLKSSTATMLKRSRSYSRPNVSSSHLGQVRDTKGNGSVTHGGGAVGAAAAVGALVGEEVGTW